MAFLRDVKMPSIELTKAASISGNNTGFSDFRKASHCLHSQHRPQSVNNSLNVDSETPAHWAWNNRPHTPEHDKCNGSPFGFIAVEQCAQIVIMMHWNAGTRQGILHNTNDQQQITIRQSMQRCAKVTSDEVAASHRTINQAALKY